MFGFFKRDPKQAPEPAAPRPNRVEEVVFRFDANYEQAKKYREELGQLDTTLARDSIPVHPGDTIKFSYRIVIEYFGQVANRLGIIQKIAEDPDMLVKVDISELRCGRSVLVDALQALDTAIARIQSQG